LILNGFNEHLGLIGQVLYEPRKGAIALFLGKVMFGDSKSAADGMKF